MNVPLRTRLALAALAGLAPCAAWHSPVHERITRAALEALPAPMRAVWAAQEGTLAKWYSLYPDIYGGVDDDKRAAMRPFCETAAGKPIHNVTWRIEEDLRALEHSLNGMIGGLRGGDMEAAAKHAGVLSHFLADSTCPAHALIPMDSSLRSVYRPPQGKGDVNLHAVIERSSPEFTLAGRKPQPAGSSTSEAASNLLARCYRIIRENREDLEQLTRAAYAGDQAAMDPYRKCAAMAGAELLADAYYTAFTLAGVPASR